MWDNLQAICLQILLPHLCPFFPFMIPFRDLIEGSRRRGGSTKKGHDPTSVIQLFSSTVKACDRGA